jgi:hypothetical protein
MFSRRFVILGALLVTLNLVLWLAGPGLAIRQGIIQELFGRGFIRAEVVKKGGADWRLARGVVTQVTSTQLTLREADTKVEQIALSPATRVIRHGHRLPLSALARRWHVLVTWPTGGVAQSVDVERIPPPPVR